MDAGIVREFRVEGGGQDIALTQAHHVAIDFGFDRGLRADRHHVRSADEYQWEVRDTLRIIRCTKIGSGLETTELTTIGVAAYDGVERAKVDIVVIVELFSQQNHAGASAEYRFSCLDVDGDRLEQSGRMQELALCSGFSAG